MCSQLGIGMLSLLFLAICSCGKSESTIEIVEEALASEYIGEIFRYLGPNNLLKNHQVLNSSDCARDLIFLEEALNKRELWALKMLDASSKIPSGIVEGNIVDLGAFDQCIGIRAEINNIQIKGKHCMYKINPIKEVSFTIVKPTMSICVPASCTVNDILELADFAIDETVKLKNIGISTDSVRCTSTDPNILTSKLTIFHIMIAIYIGFLCLCTVCDLKNRKNIEGNRAINTTNLTVDEKDKVHKQSNIDVRAVIKSEQGQKLNIRMQNALSQFSIMRCSEVILSLDSKKVNLPEVNGIRFLSTASIVFFHTYFIQVVSGNINYFNFIKSLETWTTAFILSTTCAVDTFFTLSGFLLTFVTFKKFQKGNFNLLGFYSHRYIRLTPPAAVSVYFCMSALAYIPRGPHTEFFSDVFFTGFLSKWQYGLSYVQNFIDLDDFRMLHFWSLCVDMQLFWISPLILYPLYSKPKIGLAILAILISACQILTASIYAINGYPFFYLNKDMNLTFALEAVKSTYEFPYTRASPWLFGILLAFIIDKNVKPNKVIVRCVWLSWIFILAAFGFAAKHALTHRDFIFSRDVFLAIFLRPTWAVFICWIIYTSIHNCAGPLSSFLSWKYFLPLSRISYSMYLTHIIPIISWNITSKVQLYFSDYLILHSFISDLVLCTTLAFVFSILFEVPVLTLDEMFFGDRKKPVKKTL